MKNLFLLALGLALAIGFAPRASATLLAYEGFDYPDGSDLSGQNGGIGWTNAWSTTVGDSNVLGSLNYTDALGNSLITTGNSAFVTASVGANVQCRRTNSFVRNDTSGTTWISFIGQYGGSDINRAAGFQIHTNTSERLSVGKGSTNAAFWGILSGGAVTTTVFTTNLISQTSFLVVRVDHLAGANDNVYLFVNPALNAEPDTNNPSAKFAGTAEFAYNAVRIFAAFVSPNYAELRLDEIRMGETYADVAPYIPGSSPVVRPRWISASNLANSMFLSLTGGLGSNYVIQASGNLGDTSSWTDIASVQLDGAGFGTFTDTNIVSTNAVRFYRTRLP